jgi:acetolactate synthase-1/2/3 large subunit
LAAARKPLAIVGGSRWDQAACSQLQAFAEANDVPVIASFRRQDRFDNSHPCYIGEIGVGSNPNLLRRIRDATCFW